MRCLNQAGHRKRLEHPWQHRKQLERQHKRKTQLQRPIAARTSSIFGSLVFFGGVLLGVPFSTSASPSMRLAAAVFSDLMSTVMLYGGWGGMAFVPMNPCNANGRVLNNFRWCCHPRLQHRHF